MSIDTYAICPCGSGKKIKFCSKCRDSIPELDAISKMIEGGQAVPALDRLSSVLAEHPDAAWALAVRGRLLMELREYESLTENAERFIRLQPSNPLALTQRAAARLFRGETEGATESMLEALTESGRQVDTFVLDVASVLAVALMQQGVFLTSRVYATLAMLTEDYDGNRTALEVLRALNSSPSINHLLKSIPRRIERPSGTDWTERFDEADTLLQNQKIDLAESKFQSLQRTVAAEPAILYGLLTCAIWRGDTAAQAELSRKLAACESLDFEQRARFRALAAIVDPERTETSIAVLSLRAEIQQVDEVEMGLTASSRVVQLPPDMLAEMRTGDDDVPPRSGFQLLDRDKPLSTETLPAVEDVPETIALAFVYGKQTDRSARIDLFDVRQDDLEAVRGQVTELIGDLPLVDQPGEPLPLLVAAQPAIAMISFRVKPSEAESLQAELAEQRMPGTIAGLRLPLLGGESLQSSAGDDAKLLERTAAMRIIENYDALTSKGDQIIANVYQLADLQPLPTLRPSSEELESIDNIDLSRVDSSALEPESLIYLLQRAQQVSATVALRRFAKQLIETELPAGQQSAKLLAYMALINTAGGTNQAIEYLQQAKAFAAAHDVSTASLLLTEVGLRLAAGDAAGFQQAIQSLSSRYGNDPEVMARLQQLLVAYGLVNPDGSPRRAPPSAAAPPPVANPASANQLWTPDSGAPAAPPSPSEGGGQGKLWLPGMD